MIFYFLWKGTALGKCVITRLWDLHTNLYCLLWYFTFTRQEGQTVELVISWSWRWAWLLQEGRFSSWLSICPRVNWTIPLSFWNISMDSGSPRCVLWETQNTEFLNISIKEFYQNECMNINQSIDINQYFCDVESPEASLADRLNNVFTTCDIYCWIMGICFMWEHLLFMACPPLSFFLPRWPPWLISPPAGQAYNLLKALSQTLRWLRTFIIPQKKAEMILHELN